MIVKELSETVSLVLGDAREIDLSSLPAFDAIVSDPPYGIGYVKGNTGTRGMYRVSSVPGNGRRGTRKLPGDDVPFDPAFCLTLSDNVALFGADHFSSRLPETGRWLAWDKLEGKKPWDSFSDVEFIWHSKSGPSRICSYLWKGIACRKDGEENGRRYHPTQKPIGVMEWLINEVGWPSCVLDPYAGSGSTGIACVRMGIGFIGIEIDEEFFSMAVDRLTRELAKG